jgi:alkanesulfonate monooxygenase SsuD/methylene tetrahydromethanopterin reductase-like flavin-dependent oxidoreductase (luciferase family)
VPSPRPLIAQALLRTKRIRLGPLGHLLPFHHPVERAHRVAYLDHMAEGRYQAGDGIGVLPTDHALFALDVSGGIMGRRWREFLLPIYLGLGLGWFLKRDPSMTDEAVDLAYLADNLWFVGSPQTVADRILNLQEQTGGFGHPTIVSYDATGEEAAWERSLQMLMNGVLPICRSASPGAERSTGVGS